MNRLSTDYMKISDLETRIRTLENDVTQYQQSPSTSVDTLLQEVIDTKQCGPSNTVLYKGTGPQWKSKFGDRKPHSQRCHL